MGALVTVTIVFSLTMERFLIYCYCVSQTESEAKFPHRTQIAKKIRDYKHFLFYAQVLWHIKPAIKISRS